MKTAEEIFEELIATIEKNAIDNKAEITNVKLWANSWRKELNQFDAIKSVCERCLKEKELKVCNECYCKSGFE